MNDSPLFHYTKIIIYLVKLKLSLSLFCIIPIILVGCASGEIDQSKIGGGDNCKIEDYTSAVDSPYVLPYEVGKSFLLGAGNCGGGSHNIGCWSMGFPCGDQRYAYDFNMSPGNKLVAIHDGVVISLEEKFPNAQGTGAENNYVLVEHPDGSAAHYVHLSPDGVIPDVGDHVKQGEFIAKSGASGFVGPIPHLHLVVFKEVNDKCNGPSLEECVSIPITFKNAEPLDTPLRFSKAYKALPY